MVNLRTYIGFTRPHWVKTVNSTCEISGVTKVTPFCKYVKHLTWQGVYRPRVSTVWGAVCFRSSWERAVTGRRNGLLNQTARIPHADCFRSLSERAVGTGRGRLAVTGCWGELLKQPAGIPYAIVSEVYQGRGGGPWTDGRDGLLPRKQMEDILSVQNINHTSLYM